MFENFRTNAMVRALGWPDDVVEQWLYDHGDNTPFLRDYGAVDLSSVTWDVEVVSVEDLAAMPTGFSDGDCMEEYADDPDHWVSVRRFGIHRGVRECWEIHGTWKRWPLLIDRQLVDPGTGGLQVVEG